MRHVCRRTAVWAFALSIFVVPATASAQTLRSGSRGSAVKELQRELDSEQLRTQLVVSLHADSKVRDGSETELWFDPEQAHLFDPATGENLTRYPGKPETSPPPRGDGGPRR